ncbi:uncharacterized protein TrAtP1_011884 [Trichoderma atroviride]|uniref:uncharacterized protein n=1 Tax=Hypocrea atroviridis TaxID=63577 RepID=UPI00331660A1|nr:hypothetical protein TrAtP1_011884 [Trichoderma atroviride]
MSAIIVRRPPRSKGCKQCISRRVKCDERPGCCKQCARFGLSCSGAIRGAVFLDMTEKVSCSMLKPKKKRKRKTHSTRKATENPGYEFITEDEIATCYVSVEESSCSTTPSSYGRMAESEDSSLDLCQSGDEDRGDIFHSGMMDTSITGLSLPLDSDQFSNSDVLNDGASIPPALVTSAYDEYCFVSKFTQTLTSSRRNYSTLRPESWIPKLPFLVATNSLPCPLKYALHAVALLYHAVTRDSRAERLAITYYLAGIKSYRSVVLGNQAGQSPTTSVSEEDTVSEMPHSADIVAICGPVLFSFYESLQGAGSDAELLHHSVAVEMLQVRGPDKCVDGLAHSVMRSMRVKEAFHSIMQNRSANFSSPEWLSIPFQKKHKICYDRLIDILLSFTTTLRLPNMNQKGAKLRSSIHRIHDLPTARKSKIEERAMMLLEQLQHWWLEFRDEHYEIIAQNYGTSPAVDAAYVAAESPSSVLPLSGPWMLANNETLTSSMVSIYSGIHIIIHSVLFIISISKPLGSVDPSGQSAADIHRAAISMYAASVFNAALYLNMVNPFCGDAMRTKFSINIVAQFALEDSQRDEAQQMLSQWKLRGTAPPR